MDNDVRSFIASLASFHEFEILYPERKLLKFRIRKSYDNVALVLHTPSFELGELTFQILQHATTELTELYKGSLVHREWILEFLHTYIKSPEGIAALAKAKVTRETENTNAITKREIATKVATKERHEKRLNELRIKYLGVRTVIRERHNMLTHCWSCTCPLDNSIDLECISCSWIICICGACGCGYEDAYEYEYDAYGYGYGCCVEDIQESQNNSYDDENLKDIREELEDDNESWAKSEEEGWFYDDDD